MIKFLPRSLFTRNLLVLITFAVFVQSASVTVFLLAQGPKVTEVGHLLAIELNTLNAALSQIEPARREASLLQIDRIGQLRLQQGSPPVSIQPNPLSIFGKFAAALREQLDPDIGFRWQVAPVPAVWVEMNVAGQRSWFTLPTGTVPRDRVLTSGLMLSLGLVALATIIAMLIQQRINRPLREIAEAARRLGRGSHGERLPDYAASELTAVARQFNAMSASLEAMEATRMEMLAGISHDIRTPLTKLRLTLALEARGDDSPGVGFINQIDAIVGQFLDYGRDDSGEALIYADINTLVMQIAGEFEQRGTPFELFLGHVPPFRFRPTSMLRVISNLMENALRYAGNGLEVRTHYDSGNAYIEVLDRGSGIPAEQVEHLLRPFTRADDGRSGVSGTGLGLAIVDRLVCLHGGRLRLLDRPGGGLRACVALPVSDGEASDSR
ncbi:ATP-binding protein [Pseudomonas fluorescens]|uniref:ATP-binding protein n=1 Tax=Pseudomonas fluorescens TaxID=294 RepID=UPI00159093BD|nr:ATP-binding protein [Pseudomonas fluorescens]